MKTDGLTPDKHIFVTLLDTCGKVRRADLAERYWKEMKKYSIGPDDLCWEMRMEAQLESFKLAEAIDVVTEALKENQGSARLLNSFLTSCIFCGRLVETYRSVMRVYPNHAMKKVAGGVCIPHL
jgi:pentatricopeptide repeat protein